MNLLPLRVPLLLAGMLLASSVALAAKLPDFRRLVEENRPSIVNISTTQTIRPARQALPEFPPGSPFDYFFRYFGPDMPQRPFSCNQFTTVFE